MNKRWTTISVHITKSAAVEKIKKARTLQPNHKFALYMTDSRVAPRYIIKRK